LQYHILMDIQYTLIRTNRKSIGIRISDTGEVIVRAPRYTPVGEIELVLQQHIAWIEKNKQRVADRQTQLGVLDREQIEQLRQLAKIRLTKKTEFFAARMGLTYEKITITSAKKRLGSCSTRGSICYSLYLLLYPDAAVDYVVVHELAHLVEPNHSKNFYAVVERYLPDWQARRALLQPAHMRNPLAGEEL
jgi:predicted metal-dependent hydrolase